jgi:glutaredoxin-like YruB-family protein
MDPRFARSVLSGPERWPARALLPGLLIALLSACQPQAPAVDHLAIARDLAAKLTADGQPEDLSNPAYEQVAQELQAVPSDSPQKAEADAWLKKIQDARRAKLFAVDDGPNTPPERSRAEGTRSSSGRQRQARAGGSSGASSAAGKSGGGEVSGWLGSSLTPPGPVPSSPHPGGETGVAGSSLTAMASSATGASAPASGRVSVTVYSASWCGVCKQAKAYLSRKGIPYTEKDIEKSPSARAEVLAKVGRTDGIPVIDINGQVLVGFDQNAVDQMLRKARTQ